MCTQGETKGRVGLVGLFVVALTMFSALGESVWAGEEIQQALTNDDVVRMVNAKLGNGVIIAKIKGSPCSFDTGTDALIRLKDVGLSDDILQAMAEAGRKDTAVGDSHGGTAAAEPGSSSSAMEPGIYYGSGDGEKDRVRLDPTAYSGVKTGGLFKSTMTYGIAKMKWKAVVRESRARLAITESKPDFYFQFDFESHSSSLATPWGAWFGGVSSPSQFTLVKLKTKDSHREIIVGRWGAFGGSMGTRDQDVVDFDYEEVAKGIYRVSPREGLQSGEYCFFYTGTNTAMGMGGGQLFDFGIIATNKR